MNILEITKEFFGKNAFLSIVNDILLAFIVLLSGIIIGKIIGVLIERFLHKIRFEEALKATGIKLKFSLTKVIASFVSYIIYLISIILALMQLRITTMIINALLILLIVVIGSAIIFVLRSGITNFVSFLMISYNNMLKPNDYIELGTIKGIVKEITLTETKILTKNKDIVFVPNNIIVKSILVKKKKSSIKSSKKDK